MSSKSLPSAIALAYLSEQNLISRFIDPVDNFQARRIFPKAPWKYYLMPQGQYRASAWPSFKKASAYLVRLAQEAIVSDKKTELSVEQVLNLYSMLSLRGNGGVDELLGEPVLIYNDRAYGEIQRSFQGRQYRNEDGLDLSVVGFWPVGKESLELFTARRLFTSCRQAGDWQGCAKTAAMLRRILYASISKKSSRWHLYWVMTPQQRLKRLTALLRWYHQESKRILKSQGQSDAVPLNEVISLAVKMQRYVDAAHIFPDASGRLSRLMGDYVFLRVGLMPPRPVLYKFRGRSYENGTYLPFVKALEMARQGLL